MKALIDKFLSFSKGDDQKKTVPHSTVIAEVDTMMAYGLPDKAEKLLTDAIRNDRNNPELANKLIEMQNAKRNG